MEDKGVWDADPIAEDVLLFENIDVVIILSG